MANETFPACQGQAPMDALLGEVDVVVKRLSSRLVVQSCRDDRGGVQTALPAAIEVAAVARKLCTKNILIIPSGQSNSVLGSLSALRNFSVITPVSHSLPDQLMPPPGLLTDV